MPQKNSRQENPNAFKHWIDKDLLVKIADALAEVFPEFDKKQFVALAPQLKALELKPRVQAVRDQLRHQLPDDYNRAVKILLDSLKSSRLKGFDLWPYTEFVQTYGLESAKLSLDALHKLTQKFTSEFAVRPFLRKYPEETLAFLEKCAEDSSVHVRRWASEGSRPRLPWGERLHLFIENPSRTLKVLEKLKHDSELYVRKSVANHLNDISKDHPKVVINLLKNWQSAAGEVHREKIDWIVRHSLRTLIKAGMPDALKLIGVGPKVKIAVSKLKLNKKIYVMDDGIDFTFTVTSKANKPQKLVVDYVIHFKKANGETSPKVFKLKTFTLKPKETVALKKVHPLKKITTRRYYSGAHAIEIQINGVKYAKSPWTLRL